MKKSPPKSAAPVSREVVDTIIKKKVPPAGPPPTVPVGFKPKTITARNSSFSLRRADSKRRDSDNSSGDSNFSVGSHDFQSRSRTKSPTQSRKSNCSKAHSSDIDSDSDSDKSSSNSDTSDRNSTHDSRRGNRKKEFKVYSPKSRQNKAPYANELSSKSLSSSKPNVGQTAENETTNIGQVDKKISPTTQKPPLSVNTQLMQSTDISTSLQKPQNSIDTQFIDSVGNTPTLQKPLSKSDSKILVKGKIENFNFSKFLKTAKNRQLKQFLNSPIPIGVTAKCYMERDRSGANLLGHVYTLCADLQDGTGQELMMCKKIMMSRTPHYVFSIMPDDLYKKREKRSKLYLGKLRSINTGEYVLYVPEYAIDDLATKSTTGVRGDQIESKDEDLSSINLKNANSKLGSNDELERAIPRRLTMERKSSMFSTFQSEAGDMDDDKLECVAIRFNCQQRPAPMNIRGLEICVPNPEYFIRSENDEMRSPMRNLSDLFYQIRAGGKQNELFDEECIVMHERKTKYDPLSSCLVDYHGRANMASVKNFQLVKSSAARLRKDEYADKAEDFIMQLGKTTEDCFNLDVKYPLSPFQAFAISVARFDAKLTWKD